MAHCNIPSREENPPSRPSLSWSSWWRRSSSSFTVDHDRLPEVRLVLSMPSTIKLIITNAKPSGKNCPSFRGPMKLKEYYKVRSLLRECKTMEGVIEEEGTRRWERGRHTEMGLNEDVCNFDSMVWNGWGSPAHLNIMIFIFKFFMLIYI